MDCTLLEQPPENEDLTEYLCLLTRLDNGNIPSLNQTVASYYGFDYYYLLENSSLIYEPLKITYGALIDKIALQCSEVIRILQENYFKAEGCGLIQKLDWVKQGNDDFKEELSEICKYICNVIYPNLLLTSNEITNMLRGFEGQYIEPGPSGAPSSGGADLLPTGRNFMV